MSDGSSPRRRTVLTACAAGVASLAGCGNPLSDSGGDDGSNGTSDDETNGTSGNQTTGNETNGTTGNESSGGTDEAVEAGSTIRLGGESQGWVGQQPESIVDETNPSLRLQAGETYEIVWENLDGAEHELIFVDGNGEELEASESSESESETVSMEFTAGEELAEYFCEYHPEAMRGTIEITGS